MTRQVSCLPRPQDTLGHSEASPPRRERSVPRPVPSPGGQVAKSRPPPASVKGREREVSVPVADGRRRAGAAGGRAVPPSPRPDGRRGAVWRLSGGAIPQRRRRGIVVEVEPTHPPAPSGRHRQEHVAPTELVPSFRARFYKDAAPTALPPNDPSAATRPTRAFDCNRDAMAGLEGAAAHGCASSCGSCCCVRAL